MGQISVSAKIHQCMPTPMGKYKVPHFDPKGEADQLFEERGLPVTFMMAAF